MRKGLSVVVLVITISVLGIYVWTHKSTFASIIVVQRDLLVFLLLMRLILILVQGLQTKAFLNLFDVQVRFKEWFGLSVITNMTNILSPLQGGMFVRGIYLKKRHGFSYSAFASVQLANYLLSFLLTSALGIVVACLIYERYGILVPALLALFSILLIFTATFLLISPKMSPSQGRIRESLRHALEGWNFIRSNRRLICEISLLNCVSALTLGVRLFVSYRALSLTPEFLPVFMISIVSNYTILLSITPGNLGIIETAVALVSEMMGIGFDKGLAAAVLLRGTSLLIVFTLGPLFSFLLTGELVYRGHAG
jgi:uncharacterized protein (TIRG00374 family)